MIPVKVLSVRYLANAAPELCRVGVTTRLYLLSPGAGRGHRHPAELRRTTRRWSGCCAS